MFHPKRELEHWLTIAPLKNGIVCAIARKRNGGQPSRTVPVRYGMRASSPCGAMIPNGGTIASGGNKEPNWPATSAWFKPNAS
jgi:hypothetical protein